MAIIHLKTRPKTRLCFLYIALFVSLVGNVLTFYLDVLPVAYPRLKAKYTKEKTIKKIDASTQDMILASALKMAKSPKVATVWEEPRGLTNAILARNSITSQDEFRKYNYPRAYLMYGISNFLTSKNKHEEANEFKAVFDELIDESGNPNFEINRIDQVPFGMTSLNLYKAHGEEKYLKFSDKLYQYILGSVDAEDGIVLYRKGQPIVHYDVLGMVVPFLTEYAKIGGNEAALEMAQRQLKYYINHGVDKETYLPAHAINRKHLVKVGSANWGRGIGWYFIALSHFYNETGLFEEEYQGLTQTLFSLKNSEGLWSQFPGSSDHFDASSTTMFLYSMILNNRENHNSLFFLRSLQKYISVETGGAVILQTSGDTYGPNNYSGAFSKSELSQGMLLLILSLLEKE